MDIGASELSTEDRLTYERSNKLKNYMTQSFFVAEAQTGRKGKYVPVKTAIADVKSIIQGKFDSVDENKFLFLGELSELGNN